MFRSPSGGAGPPSTLQVFQNDLIRAYLWVLRQISALIDWTFDITQEGAQRRRNVLLAAVVLLWFVLAIFTQPIPWNIWNTQPATLLLEFAKSFIAPGVLRHLLMLGLAFWLAFRHAAVYLDDIFELNDVSVAERFIRQAAFADQYDWMVIRDGGIPPESRNSPIYRIGGPGKILVHLENVVLFEKIDGSPHILGPRTGRKVLESFERLRQVVDLRDQVVEMTVHGRSKDGIHVTAKDVKLIFSVRRVQKSSGAGGEFAQPYSYTDEGIKNLIYRNNNGPWTVAMRDLIQESLRKFIAQHNLSAFLASVSPYERTGRPGDQNRASLGGTGSQGVAAAAEFVTRDQITNLFYDFTQGFTTQAERLGAELQWIGVGTWITPSEIIPEQHQEAWQKSFQNRMLGNPAALREVREESRNLELLRLIREFPLTSFGRLQAEGREPEEIIQELLLTYREKLRNAWEIYQNSDRRAPAELEAALKHLTRLTAHWLG